MCRRSNSSSNNNLRSSCGGMIGAPDSSPSLDDSSRPNASPSSLEGGWRQRWRRFRNRGTEGHASSSPPPPPPPPPTSQPQPPSQQHYKHGNKYRSRLHSLTPRPTGWCLQSWMRMEDCISRLRRRARTNARKIALAALLIVVSILVVIYVGETLAHVILWMDRPVLAGCIKFG